MIPSVEMLTITVLCLWAIALELNLRQRERTLSTFATVFTDMAYGKARVTVENGKPTIKYNRGE